MPLYQSLKHYLREEPFENHTVVVGFFCVGSVMGVDV